MRPRSASARGYADRHPADRSRRAAPCAPRRSRWCSSGCSRYLLLACTNVGNLQLARAFARRRERRRGWQSVRTARVVRQLVTETADHGRGERGGAVAGPDLPEAILRATGATPPMRVLPDTTVAAFTVVLCIVATIVTGLVPALRGTRDAADFSAASRGSFDTRRAVVRTCCSAPRSRSAPRCSSAQPCSRAA